MGKQARGLLLGVLLLAPSCNPSEVAPAPSQELPSPARATNTIGPLTHVLPISTPLPPSPTPPPWQIVAPLPSLPRSRLFYQSFDGIYLAAVDCAAYTPSCIAEPHPISPSSQDQGQMTVSPDGEIVAIARVDEYGGRGLQSSIRLISVEDGRIWRVAPMGTMVPAWSPDGGHLAYIDYLYLGGDKPRICLSTIIEPYRCFSEFDSGGPSPPVWSADGQSLLYCAYDSVSDECDVYILDVQTGTSVRIATGASSPAWFPQSNRLLFSRCIKGDCSIFIGDIAECIDLGGDCFADRSPAGKLVLPADAHDFRISPDDSYVSFKSAGRLGAFPTSCLFQLQSCTEAAILLSDPALEVVGSSWSPDGRHIAYGALSDSGTGIYIVALDGTGTIIVREFEVRFNSIVDWRPPGR